jgi:hypothetical protein
MSEEGIYLNSIDKIGYTYLCPREVYLNSIDKIGYNYPSLGHM